MRTFDLTAQIERLTASGIGRFQRLQDDVYRKLWPKSVELPKEHEGRFDRALIVDAFPRYPAHSGKEQDGHRAILPVRLLPLPGRDTPIGVSFGREDGEALAPYRHPQHGELLRYVIFWQAGQRWKSRSPNAMRSRFDADECGLRLNEGLHLPLQEETLIRERRLPLSGHMNGRGESHFIHWADAIPSFSVMDGMFAELEGVPSRAKAVVAVSTEEKNLFLKD